MSKAISLATFLILFLLGASASAQSDDVEPADLFGDSPETAPLMTAEEMAAELVKQQEKIVYLEEQLLLLLDKLEKLESAPTAENFLGAMGTDPEARLALGRATQGRLNIVNFRGVPTEIYVNGTLWSARPNRSYIYVPMGKVTVQQRSRMNEAPHIFDARDWQQQPDGSLALTYEIKQQ